ncbi:hypothetical protein Vadar_010742 [Vaccinium darrowii]|uniref:Uncharacterized protein n=1 Tax=Vaccinium darrowii TaxID=229202 RepID=A0ACB7ZBU0_9ERIC|nr:hypothetical protein Vadar_010742 [Vaccinium darrowii]
MNLRSSTFCRLSRFLLCGLCSRTHISRNLYLVEPPEHSSGCDLHEYCDRYGDAHYMPEGHCHMKLETKLKIPLRNAELAMSSEGDANVSSNSKGGTKRKRCIKLRPKDHKLNLLNSCNGFLCLSEPSQNDPVVDLLCVTQSLRDKVRVCDPITGKEDNSRRVAEIHTLGTGSWKRIGHAPSSKYGYKLRSPLYLNGAIHWLLIDYNNDEHIAERNYIVSFNFDKEIFIPVPPPPCTDAIVCLHGMEDISLGVLRDWLCICDHDECRCVMKIWVMKKYLVQESWTKLFCISTATTPYNCWLCGVYQPLTYLRIGDILFFDRLGTVVHYKADKRLTFLKVHGVKSNYEAIAYTPSFISLKDAVMGDNSPVLNIKSRCAGLKLQGEAKALFLREENEKNVFGF